MQLTSPTLTSHTISAKAIDLRYKRSWMIIGVYGPQGDLEKMFIRELKQLKQSVGGRVAIDMRF
jgi:hypothetical protein